MTTTPITSLYVHVPYCQTLCGYCDFYSELVDRQAMPTLVDALLSELKAQQRHTAPAAPPRLETIFVGGGTPTTLPPGQLQRLLLALRDTAGPSLTEFTVEANPATVSPETARVLVQSGVTRVSIGAQSFEPAELRVLDRIHQPPQVAQTVEICRAAGIQQINLDLIFAIPGQSLASWRNNLSAALALGPDHLSCYSLTFERGTPLFDLLQAGQIQRSDADLDATMYEATLDDLAAAGFAQYEISNFARPGAECRHNITYWRNGGYLGIGPSAAGFVDGVRYKNVPDTAEYVRAVQAGRSPRIQSEQRSADQRARETIMLGLRLNVGVLRRDFAERFGNDPAERFAETVSKHVELGLLELTPDALRLTRAGRLLADTVAADFL